MDKYKKYENLIGKKFNMLTVVGVSNIKAKGGGIQVECLCDCNTHKIFLIRPKDLINGHTKSCGCLRGEKHNDTKSRLHNIWSLMRSRCYNHNNSTYKNYGGRGIEVCKEWESYSVFKNWALNNGYSDDLTIDRIDVNGNYEPSNCRWANRKVQANNKTDNNIQIINGETLTLSQACDKYNKNYDLVKSRLLMGWSIEESLELKKHLHKSTKKIYKIKGEQYSLGEISKKYNIPYSTLRYQLNKGNDIVDIVKKYNKNLEEAV